MVQTGQSADFCAVTWHNVWWNFGLVQCALCAYFEDIALCAYIEDDRVNSKFLLHITGVSGFLFYMLNIC